MKSFIDLSNILEIEPKKLSYIIFVIPSKDKYSCFEIKKKGGGKRKINRPSNQLFVLQRKFKKYLEGFYSPKICSHGFEINKNIKTNAIIHLKSKVILNIDLKDFFDSINFGRIYGLFLSQPFNFDKKASVAITNLVTFDNKLPQGAPTSPILANMIARNLDTSLNNPGNFS